MASNTNGRNQLPALTDETIKELLSVQRQELAIRLAEVQRDNTEIGHSQSIAKQSIEAQERDRKHEREEVTKRQKSQQWFTLAIVIILMLFASYAIYSGQTSLILDIVKVIIGFAGGMGYQAYKNYNKSTDED